MNKETAVEIMKKYDENLTKWEAFATLKGIHAKKKKSRIVWCEITNSWKPR